MPYLAAGSVAPQYGDYRRWPLLLATARVPEAFHPEWLASRAVPPLAYVAGGHGALVHTRAGLKTIERAPRPPALRLAAGPPGMSRRYVPDPL